MNQRLVLVLTVLFYSGVVIGQNIMTPTDGDYIYDPKAAFDNPAHTNPAPVSTAGIMQKWVHDTAQKIDPLTHKAFRITWEQTDFKSYRLNGMSFRLRFPKNYDTTKKYPIIIFLHGAGEAAALLNNHNSGNINRENQDQLYWGARTFRDRIDADQWNGFLLFPQLLAGVNNAGSEWNLNTIDLVNDILDRLEQYNGVDPDRVIAMGLSAGGLGSIKYAALYPQRIAAVISSAPVSISDVIPDIDKFVHIPIWASAGGRDVNPVPQLVLATRDQITAKGANFYLSYYATREHDTWEQAWNQSDKYNNFILSAYWNNASKAQPLLYFQNDKFCTGRPINAKMGITAGFYAYEWQFNNGGGFTTIAGAVANTYIATQAGQYRVHFKRSVTANWSAWSPNPIVISTKTCSADTAFAEHFETSPIPYYVTFSAGPGGGNSPYFQNNIECQNGLFVNSTQVFTHDATGRQGGKFMLNNTTARSVTPNGNGSETTHCGYFAGDQVWRSFSPATVTPNTNYAFSFYMGNEGIIYSATPTLPITKITAKINDAALSPLDVQAVLVGDISWKKYSFVWNSGAATTAGLAITNSTTDGTGNDFVLDEISLVKYTPPVMPGDAFKNVTLWSKANTVTGYDGGSIGMWANSNVNGNNLQQPVPFNRPLLRNNAADNINFNPVIAFNSIASNALSVPGGFSDTANHNAVHIFMVAKFNNIAENVNILGEGTNATTADSIRMTNPGKITWKAGDLTNTLVSPGNTIEKNKSALFTFSKDNSFGTGNGNKQDIRKNGSVVAFSNAATPFTGSNADFKLGTFGGSIAEVIYILDSQVTALKQNRIESYLAIKYGTTLGTVASPVNYTASDSTTVFWTASNVYQNDVFGIGTDSLSGLVQARSNSVNSGSGDGTGQPSKGNLVLAADTTLADKRFLMIGNDAAPLTETVIASGDALPQATGSTRLLREWKVINTGTVGKVNLSFDTTGLAHLTGGPNINNYALLVDNDGDGNFSNGTISFFAASSVTGKKLNFTGVVLNNGVVFTIITNRVSAALPAVWLGFTAKAVNETAVLNWKTGGEINVDRYVVEFSLNGTNFNALGSVPAFNGAGINNYNFTDSGLAAGIHYYRIRRIDKDGRTAYSDTQVVKINFIGANVQVRPNPVVGAALVLAVAVQQNTNAIMRVMSADGKIILQKSINLIAGSHLVNLDMTAVPSGIYMIQVKLGDETVIKKFIRQQ